MKKIVFVMMLLFGMMGFPAGTTYESTLIKKMEVLEAKMQPALDSGVTSEMINASVKLSEAWDVEINKVYKLIMEKLPEKEKTKLRNDQRNWVKEKEKKAKEAGKEFEGGTGESLMYSQTELTLTKKRTLELAKHYDKLNGKK